MGTMHCPLWMEPHSNMSLYFSVNGLVPSLKDSSGIASNAHRYRHSLYLLHCPLRMALQSNMYLYLAQRWLFFVCRFKFPECSSSHLNYHSYAIMLQRSALIDGTNTIWTRLKSQMMKQNWAKDQLTQKTPKKEKLKTTGKMSYHSCKKAWLNLL